MCMVGFFAEVTFWFLPKSGDTFYSRMQTMGTFKDLWKSDPGMDSLGWIGPAGALIQTFGLAGTAPIDVSTYPWQEKNDQLVAKGIQFLSHLS